MIEVKDLVARTRSGTKVELGPVSLSFPPAAGYALVGTPLDGVELLLAVLAGAAPQRAGSVTIDGTPASPRARIAHVPHLPELPDVLRVDEYLELAARIRGEPPLAAKERLEVLGVAPLAVRRMGHLTRQELRAVALVEALTSHATVLLLVEPLADLDPRAVGRVPPALQARVEAGATLVLSTSSHLDARTLARELIFFSDGKVMRRAADDAAWEPPIAGGVARLLIQSEDARRLLGELASDAAFREVRGDNAEVVVTGEDPIAMATAVANATRRASIAVDVLTFLPDRDDK